MLCTVTTSPWPKTPKWLASRLTRVSHFFWLDSPSLPRPTHYWVEIIHRHTTFGKTPLDEGSAHRRPLPDNTQQSQGTEIHEPGGIRSRSPSRRAAADPRLRSRGHQDRQIINLVGCSPYFWIWRPQYQSVYNLYSEGSCKTVPMVSQEQPRKRSEKWWHSSKHS